MINVTDYIKMILNKKKWTLTKFAEEINKVKKQVGIDSKTTTQNISNFLNQVDKDHILRPKQLCLFEKALGLAPYTLTNMVKEPLTKTGKNELKKIYEEISKIN